VWSIAPRLVPVAGGQGVERDEESRAAGNVVGDSVGRSGAAGGGDCVIEFVTGYKDGTVRMWCAVTR
jgi:hypothetical protein